jgi:hypothetical protein
MGAILERQSTPIERPFKEGLTMTWTELEDQVKTYLSQKLRVRIETDYDSYGNNPNDATVKVYLTLDGTDIASDYAFIHIPNDTE